MYCWYEVCDLLFLWLLELIWNFCVLGYGDLIIWYLELILFRVVIYEEIREVFLWCCEFICLMGVYYVK